MPQHKLCSPSHTYLVLPTLNILPNKVQNQAAKHGVLKDTVSLANGGPTMAAQNGQKFLICKKLGPPPTSVHNQPEKQTTVTSEENQIYSNAIKIEESIELIDEICDIDSEESNGNAGSGADGYKLPSSSTKPGTSNAEEKQVKDKSKNKGRESSRSLASVSGTDQVKNCILTESDSNSESDSSSDFAEHIKRGQGFIRLPYSSAEDAEILKYVMLGDNINRTGSLSLWSELERRKTKPKRSFQSMKNRFLRNIKPHLLTRYKSLLSAEDLKKVKRKFPELERKVSREHVIVKEYVTKRPHGSGNLTRRLVDSDRSVPRAAPEEIGTTTSIANKSVCVDESNRNARKNLNSNGQCKRVVIPEEPLPDVEADKTTSFPLKKSESAGHSTAMELFVPRQTHTLPVQTFHSTKILKTLQDKTNLNLNIVLVKDQLSNPESKLVGPFKVDIVVSLTRLHANGNEKTDTRNCQVEEVFPTQTVKKKKVKASQKNRISRCQFKYVLRLKKSNHQRLANKSPCYKQILADLLQKIETNRRKNSENKETPAAQTACETIPRRVTQEPHVGPTDPPDTVSSDETNCSFEDESGYSEAYREVAKRYPVIFLPDTDESPEATEDKEENLHSRKQPKIKNSSKRNVLLQNMVGMLSPASKLIIDGCDKRRSLSKNL